MRGSVTLEEMFTEGGPGKYFKRLSSSSSSRQDHLYLYCYSQN